ncbi:MAG: hypothetical protein C0412_11650 [Flavobacterium sp.]|nr:hypothetical protein [Flavobacterium sp.]
MDFRILSKFENLLLIVIDYGTAFGPAIVSIAIFLTHPSWSSFSLLVLSFLSGILMFSIIQSSNVKKRMKDCLSGFAVPFSKCKFTEYPISDFSNSNTVLENEISGVPFFFAKKTHYLLIKRNIRIFVVKKGESQVVPADICTYEGDFGIPSLIFIRDEPNKINVSTKFYILHEIGHASYQNATTRAYSRSGWKFFIYPFLWCLLLFRYSIVSIVLSLVFLLVLSLSIKRSKEIHSFSYQEELGADLYAIRCLTEEERNYLKDYIRIAGSFPYSPTKKNPQNVKRGLNLAYLIEHFSDVAPTHKPSSFMVDIYTVRYLSILSFLLFFMGLTCKQPPKFILSLFTFVAVFLLFILVVQLVQGFELLNKIETAIGLKPPPLPVNPPPFP